MLDLYPAFDHIALAIAVSVDDLSVQGVIDQYAAFMPEKAKSVLKSYRSLLYHMSGARVVHSESFLPQENLVDCDVLTAGDRSRLSEDAIFFKIFVEQALATLGRKQIPIEVLDQISLPEILTLRSVYGSSGFIEHYDKMIEALLGAAISRDPRRAVVHLEELELAREYLFSNFTRHFEKELSRFAKSKRVYREQVFGQPFNVSRSRCLRPCAWSNWSSHRELAFACQRLRIDPQSLRLDGKPVQSILFIQRYKFRSGAATR